MKKPETQVRVQLGSLMPHVQASADKHGHSLAIEIRRILAEYLKVPMPKPEEFQDYKKKQSE